MAYLATSINTSPVIVEPAGEAIADVRGAAVKFDDNGNIVLAAAGDTPVGVGLLTNDVTLAAGADVNVQHYGIGAVLAGAAIKKGAGLAVGTNGAFVPATSGTPVAIALQAAPAAGAYIQAILK